MGAFGRPRVIRVNADDPGRMARMLRNGVVWTLPMLWQRAVDAIERGEVPLEECKDVPPEVLALLRREE
jgi:hypothetical protein